MSHVPSATSGAVAQEGFFLEAETVNGLATKASLYFVSQYEARQKTIILPQLRGRLVIKLQNIMNKNMSEACGPVGSGALRFYISPENEVFILELLRQEIIIQTSPSLKGKVSRG